MERKAATFSATTSNQKSRTLPRSWREKMYAAIMSPVSMRNKAAEFVGIPHGKVRILDGQCRERRGLTGRKGLVESGELPEEHTLRPGVEDDVVLR